MPKRSGPQVQTNCDVAALTKVNELADRHGLKPQDFIATVKWGEGDEGPYMLCFEVPAQGNDLREKRFAKMLDDLSADHGIVQGTIVHVLEAIDKALQVAPRGKSSQRF